jgi:DedD protein
MPDPAAPQLDELRRRARRRLVGAIVLALAAAVLVPMLLESDPKPLGEDVSVKIPPVDDGKFVTKIGEHAKPADASKAASAKPESNAAPGSTAGAMAPSEPTKEAATASGSTPPAKSLSQAEQRVLAPSSRPGTKETAPAGGKASDGAGTPSRATESSAVPASAPKASDPTPSSASPPGVSTKQADAATSKAPAPDATKPPASASPSSAKGQAESFSVQLAAFADDKGANALAGKLKKAGHPAYTEPYSTSRGTLWRVRVGPYTSRDAAEAAREKLKSEGQSGIIAAAR